jgi:SAM-dependent methyltransferase
MATDRDQPGNFYARRYSAERQRLRDMLFAEVYDGYFGQSSWVSTADYDRFAQWLELTSASCVLDIACGAGQPLLRLVAATGSSGVGIDSSEHAIDNATALALERGVSERARFEVQDAGKELTFDDRSFDAVMCIDALSHLPNHARVIADWARVLKPHSRLVFTDQVLTGPISNAEVAARTPHGHFLFVLDGYDERQLNSAGFELLRRVDLTSSFVSIAARHCAVRARHAEALRTAEGDQEFELQNRYRATAEVLAREGRLSHFVYVARKAA